MVTTSHEPNLNCDMSNVAVSTQLAAFHGKFRPGTEHCFGIEKRFRAAALGHLLMREKGDSLIALNKFFDFAAYRTL